MYMEDVAEFARVLLTTTEMTFDCSWQHIQILFFCQLAAITASRPGPLLHLRYWDITLTFVDGFIALFQCAEVVHVLPLVADVDKHRHPSKHTKKALSAATQPMDKIPFSL